jgi:hypothetical protein
MSPLRWTVKSIRTLAQELSRAGHRVNADTVVDLLREEGFSLQAKTIEGSQRPDRDAQFRYLNEQAREHRVAGQPVISVGTKKKELVGEFKNNDRQWRPTGEPVPVNVHGFADPQLGKAVPYGIYDLAANTGWVNVGTDHDTTAFAVESIRRWWHGQGQAACPQAERLLITADAGGSNGYRTRAWKLELARLVAETGLTSHEVIGQSIAATTTHTGLRVSAALDTNTCPTESVSVTRRWQHAPDPPHIPWRMELRSAPQPHPAVPAARGSAGVGAAVGPGLLSDPVLTGMSRQQLDVLTGALGPRRRRPARPSAQTASPNRSWPPCSICGSPWPRNLLPYCSAAAGQRCAAPFPHPVRFSALPLAQQLGAVAEFERPCARPGSSAGRVQFAADGHSD